GFFIGRTNFGVDIVKSTFGFSATSDGKRVLNIEIYGDQDVYDKTTAEEDSEWSWTLYPPFFYLRGYSIPATTKAQERTIEFTSQDLENIDLALYMMEHNTVEDVSLKISDIRVEISGQVDLIGDMMDFSINLTK